MREDRTPPHSLAAEANLLGALMLDRRAFDRLGALQATDFYSALNRDIFDACKRLDEAGKEVDVVTVYEAMKAAGKADDVKNGAVLTGLANECPMTVNVSAWARTIRDHATRRHFVSVSSDLTERALAGEETSALLEGLQTASLDLGKGDETGTRSLKQCAGAWMDNLARLAEAGDADALKTGIRAFDARIGQLLADEFIIFAGRPGAGKTGLLGTIAETVGRLHEVLFFSAEMSGEQVAKRYLARGIPADRLRDPSKMTQQDWNTVRDNAVASRDLKIHVSDIAGITIAQLEATARRHVRERGVKLILVDYIQLVTAPHLRDRLQEVSYISRRLKGLSKSLGVPVIAAAQLNRGVEGRTDKRPMMSDLRESGQLEQDADLITFLYRHKYYNPDFSSDATELITAKYREGEPGTDLAMFRPTRQDFRGATDDEIADYEMELGETGNNRRGSGRSAPDFLSH